MHRQFSVGLGRAWRRLDGLREPQEELFRGGSIVAAGLVSRVLVQTGYFVLLARTLGVAGYGALAATIALVGIVAPFANAGMGGVLIMSVARDRTSWPVSWSAAIRVTLVMGSTLAALMVGIAWLLLPRAVPLQLIMAVCVSDLLCARLVDLSSNGFQAHHAYLGSVVFRFSATCLRLGALVVAIRLTGHAGLGVMGLVYLLPIGLTAAGAVVLTSYRFGPPRRGQFDLSGSLKHGFLFSVSLASQSIYNDVDKAMLGSLSTAAAAGTYTAAYRIVDLAFTPLTALLTAAYPKFFVYGAEGVGGALRLVRRLAVPVMLIALLAACTLTGGAPLIRVLLGRQYSGATGVVRALAILPILRAGHYLAADALTGGNRQGIRSLAQLGVAVFNVGINLWLIPTYGYKGAVVSSIASDGLLAMLLWVIVIFMRARAHATERQEVAPTVIGGADM